MGAAPFLLPTIHRPIATAADGPAGSAPRRRFTARFVAAGLLLGLLSGAAPAQSLRGSSASLDRQVLQARRHDFTHLASARQLRRFVDAGYLVRVTGNRDYALAGVSFPFARPEVRLFIERLSAQYRRACGEQLVVTSLTRPRSHQPRNASDRSVHPTGMAIDLRRPAGRCRAWLESVLLSLEARGVLEATAERRPPHYHVAVYPRPYAAYVARLTARAGGAGEAATPASGAVAFHVVRRGDTLSGIAGRHGSSVAALRRANGLGSSLIRPGQTLRIPGAQRVASRSGDGAGASAEAATLASATATRVAAEPVSAAPPATATLPAAEPAAAVPPPAAAVVHVVRRGDTLSGIAGRHGSSVAALRRANGLGSSLIRPGQALRIPGAQPVASRSGGGTGAPVPVDTPAAPAAAAAPVVHVVRRGDTLSGIARRHGSSVAALRRANGLGSSLIRAGQTLRVPGAQRVASRSGADATALHVVRRGDTLSGIAGRYGASVAAVRRANGLTSSLIRPGQTLRVPRAQS